MCLYYASDHLWSLKRLTILEIKQSYFQHNIKATTRMPEPNEKSVSVMDVHRATARTFEFDGQVWTPASALS